MSARSPSKHALQAGSPYLKPTTHTTSRNLFALNCSTSQQSPRLCLDLPCQTAMPVPATRNASKSRWLRFACQPFAVKRFRLSISWPENGPFHEETMMLGLHRKEISGALITEKHEARRPRRRRSLMTARRGRGADLFSLRSVKLFRAHYNITYGSLFRFPLALDSHPQKYQ